MIIINLIYHNTSNTECFTNSLVSKWICSFYTRLYPKFYIMAIQHVGLDLCTLYMTIRGTLQQPLHTATLPCVVIVVKTYQWCD